MFRRRCHENGPGHILGAPAQVTRSPSTFSQIPRERLPTLIVRNLTPKKTQSRRFQYMCAPSDQELRLGSERETGTDLGA